MIQVATTVSEYLVDTSMFKYTAYNNIHKYNLERKGHGSSGSGQCHALIKGDLGTYCLVRMSPMTLIFFFFFFLYIIIGGIN